MVLHFEIFFFFLTCKSKNHSSIYETILKMAFMSKKILHFKNQCLALFAEGTKDIQQCKQDISSILEGLLTVLSTTTRGVTLWQKFSFCTQREAVRAIVSVRPVWYTWYYPLPSRGVESMRPHQRPPYSFKKKKKKKTIVSTGSAVFWQHPKS